MEVTFVASEFEVVLRCLDRQKLYPNEMDDRKAEKILYYHDDTLIRELYQWSAAAFACGLIESPRIERM